MATELEELVEFLHHTNPQIHQLAAQNLVGYTQSHASLFKRNNLEPVTDLMRLVDTVYSAKDALTMLINLTSDPEVLVKVAHDPDFTEVLLSNITNQGCPYADLVAMLLANLAKDQSITKLLTLKRVVPTPLSTSPIAVDQLLDLFVKGADRSHNEHANFDYLSYVFADMTQHDACRAHFLTPRKEDGGIVPLTKIIVFTEHEDDVRRRGVASTIKNAAFDIQSHPALLAGADEPDAVNILPYILLPLMGSEDYSDEDMDGMLEDLQLLPPDKRRESDAEIIKTHLDTLTLLTTTRQGRDKLRDIKAYPIVRNVHLHVEDEDVREACDRFVQVTMRDEEGDFGQVPSQIADEPHQNQESEDDRITEI